MDTFLVEDFVLQNLGDRETKDYFPGDGELSQICWRQVCTRCTTLSLSLCAIETRKIPLPTPGISTVGSWWAYFNSEYHQGLYYKILNSCAGCTDELDQPQHKYGLFQSNIYVDGVYYPSQPFIDEVSLIVDFGENISGAVTLVGRPINLNRLMHDVYMMIAGDIAKLAIMQSSMGSSVDLRSAAQEARRQAGYWMSGTMIKRPPLKGARR